MFLAERNQTLQPSALLNRWCLKTLPLISHIDYNILRLNLRLAREVLLTYSTRSLIVYSLCGLGTERSIMMQHLSDLEI